MPKNKSLLHVLPFYKSRIDAYHEIDLLIDIQLLKKLPFYKSHIDRPIQKRRLTINKRLLSALPFYKESIDYGNKHKVRRLDNAELLDELPFYRPINKKLTKSNFKAYARSYAIEKLYDEPLSQLNASKPTIKNSLKNY